MAHKEEYIEDLQHVYRECVLSDDEVSDAPGIANTFNRVVEEMKKECSDDFIKQVDTVKTASRMGRAMRLNNGKVSQMKRDSRFLLRKLGGEVPDIGDDGNDAPMVNMDVDLDQNQSVENITDINIDAVIDSIDEEHVREWAEEFRDELEKDENADEDRLRDLYRRIFGYSKPVAASLVASAITRGVDMVI